MKKKIFATVLSLALAMSLVACGEKKEETASNAASTEATTKAEEKKEEFVKVDEAITTEEPVEEPEEIVEDEPQTVDDLANALKEGEPYQETYVVEHPFTGDTIILSAKKATSKTYPTAVPVKEIDGALYRILQPVNGPQETYRTFVEEIAHRVGSVGTNNGIEMDAKAEAYTNNIAANAPGDFDAPAMAYLRIEPTDTPQRVKVTVKLEAPFDINWLQSVVDSSEGQALPTFGISTPKVRLFIDYDKFNGDTAVFYTDIATLQLDEEFMTYLNENPTATVTDELYMANYGAELYVASSVRNSLMVWLATPSDAALDEAYSQRNDSGFEFAQ